MPPDPQSRSSGVAWIAPLGAFLVYAALHFALLYHPGLVRMDDFGYLQSVAETIIRGRPYNHDSVAPYSATMSVLGAGVYALTGDFPWATWGLQALFTLAAFPLLYSLLRARLDRVDASLLTLALATQPMYWYRCSEYTSNVFALVFVLAALWAYRKGAWAWFFLSAFLAFANRQNSLALMALPAWHLVLDGAAGSVLKRKLAAGLILSAAACILLHLAMNPALARNGDFYGSFDLRNFLVIGKAAIIGASLGLAFLSFLLLLSGDDAAANLKRNLARPARPLALSIAFLSPPLIALMARREFHGFVEMHTPLLDSLDRGGLVQWALGLAAPVLLWLLDWKRVRMGAPLALFAAYVLITAARGFWYDFYLAEAGLAALFLFAAAFHPAGIPDREREGGPIRKPEGGPIHDPERGSSRAKPWGRFAMLGLIAMHAAWGYGYRIRADKDRLKVRVYEKLERETGLRPDRMTDAPWGYLGWKLYDVFAAREVPGAQRYFVCYLLADQVIVDTGLPWRSGFRRGEEAAGSVVLERAAARIGFRKLPYRVTDLSRPGAKPVHPGCHEPLEGHGYAPKPFPLDAGEWGDLLTAGSRHYQKTGQSPFYGPSASDWLRKEP